MDSDSDMGLTDGDYDDASIHEEDGWMTAVSQEHHGVEQDDLVSTAADDEENEDVVMEEDGKEDGEHDRLAEYVSTYLGPSLLLPAVQSSTDTMIDYYYRTH